MFYALCFLVASGKVASLMLKLKLKPYLGKPEDRLRLYGIK